MHTLTRWLVTPAVCITCALAALFIAIFSVFLLLTLSGTAQQGIEGAPTVVTVTDLNMTTGFLTYGAVAGITASTTQTQGQQPLTASANEVSVVANRDDVVTVPPVAPGLSVTIANLGANRLQMFPAAGDGIGTTAVDASYPVEPGECVHLIGIDTVRWMVASTTALGQWVDVPFNAGDFTANGSMTWTVEAGDVIEFRYVVIGQTMWVSWFFDNTSVGGTLNNTLRVALPGGYEIDGSTRTLYRRRESAAFAHAWLTTAAGDAFFQLRMFDNSNWAASTNSTDLEGSAVFSIVVP